jgi:hypothetical protein
MKFRQIKSDPFARIMTTGTMAVSMNSQVSHIITPMRNVDIKRAAKTGDWTELLEKAAANTRRFRRDFYEKKA